MDSVKYDFAYMFFYSERPGTPAAKKLKDDISEEDKQRRLQEVINKQREHSLHRNQRDIGKLHRVLIEGESKRSASHLQGRTSSNKVVVFPAGTHKKGTYVNVKIEDCTAATLLGNVEEN
jgi:tRNA-2-methylthio-N6-dimethylallyladenosine synthase